MIEIIGFNLTNVTYTKIRFYAKITYFPTEGCTVPLEQSSYWTFLLRFTFKILILVT